MAPRGPLANDPEVRLLELCDWCIGTACCLHDGHNAIKWAMAPFSNASLLSDLNIVLLSIRNGFSFICQSVPGFVTAHLEYSLVEEDVEEVSSCWRLLGCEVDMIEYIAFVNPRWDGSRLLVSEKTKTIPDHVAHVCDIVLYCCKFKRFTGSLWLTSGPQSRHLLSALFLGLDKIVADALANPLCSNYHLHGFSHAGNTTLRTHVCISAIASYCAESAIVDMLEDSRLVRSLDVVVEAVRDECQYVSPISTFAWSRLAGIVGDVDYTAPLLQSDAIHATHVQAVCWGTANLLCSAIVAILSSARKRP